MDDLDKTPLHKSLPVELFSVRTPGYNMPPVQRELAAGGHQDFSFTGNNGREEDDAGYNRWSQQVLGKYGHPVRNHNLRLGVWARSLSGDYKDSANWDEMKFQWVAKGENNSFLEKGRLSDSNYLQDNSDDPTIRSQVIAKHQQEMMKLIQDVPESAYELTLQDLVEFPRTKDLEQDDTKGTDGLLRKKRNEQKKGKEGKRQISRSVSMDRGAFLLKMFFPISLAGRSKSGIVSSKVSPKQTFCEEKCEQENITDSKPWNRSRYGGTSRMSSRSSSRSGSHSSRGIMNGCYPFFYTKSKSKSREDRGH